MRSRSEKMVFYLSDDENELNQIVNAIEDVKNTYPEIFENVETNPFTENLDGITYSNEVIDTTYTDISGNKQYIDASYNTLLASALEDSYMISIKDMATRKKFLAEKINGDNFKEFNSILGDIMDNPTLKQQLILGIKHNLKICMQQNPTLKIKGLDVDNSMEEFERK